MLGPRWRKVWRDAWGNKARAGLIVLSIAVGVSATGMIATSRAVLAREMTASYFAANPASADLLTEPFDDELVQAIRNMPGVQDAEGWCSLSVRAKGGAGPWRNLSLTSIVDFDDIRLNRIVPERGSWPPRKGEVLIERAALSWLGARLGDTMLIETPEGRQHRLRVAGTAYDARQGTPLFTGVAAGYVTPETLAWLGEPTAARLSIIPSGDRFDREHVRRVADRVRNQVEASGRSVAYVSIAERLDEHPLNNMIQPLILVLGTLGLLSLLLSGLLIVNTISALLAQQIRQIGVMKAVGGRTGQIMGMYLAMILAYSLLALAISIPLGALGAQAFTHFMGGFLNAEIAHFAVPWQTIALQVAAGLLVPVLAALYPVLTGARVTVREAIASYGLAPAQARVGRLDRLLSRLHGLGRPFLLSLRNTFRRTTRLLLTLATLTLAGAMFVAVFSLRASLLRTVDETLGFTRFDITIQLSQPERLAQIRLATQGVPGLVTVEGRFDDTARRLRPDGSESANIFLQALPAETHLTAPVLLEGRWLLPDDENALVINSDLLRDDPDVGVGSDIVLKVAGRETTWRVVGIIKAVLTNVPPVPFVYANYPYYARAMRAPGRANTLQLETSQHDAGSRAEVARAVEERLKGTGLGIAGKQTASEIRARVMGLFGALVALLLVMAVLLAVVGGLGLMGTMGLNVLERRREIGVMRALGASDRALRGIIAGEAVTIGVLSWLAGCIVALPLSWLLGNAVGILLLRMPLVFTFSTEGALGWLALVVVLSAAASLAPAHSASRLTVREVLAYE